MSLRAFLGGQQCFALPQWFWQHYGTWQLTMQQLQSSKSGCSAWVWQIVWPINLVPLTSSHTTGLVITLFKYIIHSTNKKNCLCSSDLPLTYVDFFQSNIKWFSVFEVITEKSDSLCSRGCCSLIRQIKRLLYSASCRLTITTEPLSPHSIISRWWRVYHSRCLVIWKILSTVK